MPVEIHWRLVDNSYFFPEISALSPTRIVTIPAGAGLRTLDDNDLFAYLRVHGATHGWSRLKWLADAAALMARDSASVLSCSMPGGSYRSDQRLHGDLL